MACRKQSTENEPCDHGSGDAIFGELGRLLGQLPTPYPYHLFGAAIEPENTADPQEVLRAIAKSLADHHGLAEDRVLACVQRHFQADVVDRSQGRGSFDPTFVSRLPQLLPEALKRLPAEAALKLCETEDPVAFYRRVKVAQQLASSYTPLYTLDELAGLLSELVEHQQRNQDSLLRTGHPRTFLA